MLLEESELIVVLTMIIILILILCLISLVNRNETEDYPVECKYLDPAETNNGDIVLVSYYSIAGGMVTSFSKSIWSHTGTIWVDPLTNIRYVLEGAIYRHKKYKHFFKIPLETWLYFNRKSILGYKKYYGPSIDSTFLWSKFEWMIGKCNLESFNIFWSRFLLNKEYYDYTRLSKYTCLEATIMLGQNAGIYKKDKIYCSYFPGDIANNNISLCEGVHYDLPIQISLHPSNYIFMLEDINFHPECWKN